MGSFPNRKIIRVCVYGTTRRDKHLIQQLLSLLFSLLPPPSPFLPPPPSLSIKTLSCAFYFTPFISLFPPFSSFAFHPCHFVHDSTKTTKFHLDKSTRSAKMFYYQFFCFFFLVYRIFFPVRFYPGFFLKKKLFRRKTQEFLPRIQYLFIFTKKIKLKPRDGLQRNFLRLIVFV